MRCGLLLIVGFALALIVVLLLQGPDVVNPVPGGTPGSEGSGAVQVGGSPLHRGPVEAATKRVKRDGAGVTFDDDAMPKEELAGEAQRSLDLPDFFTREPDPEITSPLPSAYELVDSEGPVVRMNYDDGTLWFEAYGARNADGDWTRDGPWNCWHSNGESHEQGGYRGGVEHGPWKWWYPDGNRMATGRFVDGSREGPWDFYFDTGDLAVRGGYRNDRGNGVWTLYYPSGARQAEGAFGESGAQGQWTVWKQTGAIDRERSGWYVGGVLRER